MLTIRIKYYVSTLLLLLVYSFFIAYSILHFQYSNLLPICTRIIGLLVNYRLRVSNTLAAALRRGLLVRDCEHTELLAEANASECVGEVRVLY